MMYELKDKSLKCLSCEKDFIFTKGEQEFYLEKAFAEPRRCDDCRKLRKKDKRKKRKQLIRTLQQSPDVEVAIVEAKIEKPKVKRKAKSKVETVIGLNVGEEVEKAEFKSKK